MLFETLVSRWRRARRTNTTDAAYPARVATLTKPSGAGNAVAQTTSAVFNMCNDSILTQNSVLVKPYGAGANNATISMKVIAWSYLIEDGAAASAVWDYITLCEVLATLSSSITGPSGGTVTTTDLFADTITLVSGNDDVTISITSPADDTPAYFRVDFEGGHLLEFLFKIGTATNANALFRSF